MSLYLPRDRGKNISVRYDSYRQRCAQISVEPVSFRSWAIIDAEYDIEWAAAQRDYDEAVGQLESERR